MPGNRLSLYLICILGGLQVDTVLGFALSSSSSRHVTPSLFGIGAPTYNSALHMSHSIGENKVERYEPGPNDEPLAFIDLFGPGEPRWIDVDPDYIIQLNGVEYTVGVPCDYSVAICYYDDDDQLVPVDIDSELMDDIFPICKDIIQEEFGDELVLARTPQTLTLVGELEEGESEDDGSDDAYDEFIDENDIPDEDEEDVEMLLAFEVDSVEYNLVKLLDPVMLVAKRDSQNRYLILDEEESETVLPQLEEMFVQLEEIESATEDNHLE